MTDAESLVHLMPLFDKMGVVAVLAMIAAYLGYIQNNALKGINSVLTELKDITKELVRNSEITHRAVEKEIIELRDEIGILHRAVDSLVNIIGLRATGISLPPHRDAHYQDFKESKDA